MDFVFRNKKGDGYINDKEILKIAINNNSIVNYYKIPLFKVGDYVTCCHREESIDPKNEKDAYDAYGWELGKIVKIEVVDANFHNYYITSQVNAYQGIYASGLRYATKEEIALYNSTRH